MCREDMAKWMLQTIALDFGFVGSNCEDYDQQMLHDHGGGREKPKWAERIGKKYMWVALHQLASRLHDNVVPKQDDWEPAPIRTPFILAEKRQLDPSLALHQQMDGRHPFFTTPRLNTVGAANDHAWIALEEDVPSISELLRVQAVEGQDWRPLVAYLSSGRPHDHDSSYRQIWMNLHGYLVRPSDAAIIFKELSGRKLHGTWMPKGLRLGSGGEFVAEYPWATSFNVMPDEWYSDASDERLSKLLTPAWNELLCEWEYDASLEAGGVSINVPARLLFAGDGLWWDGKGGYQSGDGSTVFLDPSMGLKGPSALLAEVGHLGSTIREVDRCLIWTLLGQKWMLGGSMRDAERTPIKQFSQVAWMNAEGAIQESDLVFFDDPAQSTGPT